MTALRAGSLRGERAGFLADRFHVPHASGDMEGRPDPWSRAVSPRRQTNNHSACPDI